MTDTPQQESWEKLIRDFLFDGTYKGLGDLSTMVSHVTGAYRLGKKEERTRLLDEVRVAISKAIKHGTLPNPNPYGTTVKVARHNQVVGEMEKILLKTLDTLGEK